MKRHIGKAGLKSSSGKLSLAVALLLSAVALLATTVPAVRATRVDPMDALRC